MAESQSDIMAGRRSPQASDDQAEKTFRKKNLWHSFLTAAYGAIGMAAYMGSLMTIANGVVGIAAGATAAASIFAPVPLLVMAGLAALGTVCTYLSQYEATEVRCLQDEHLADRNASKLAPTLGTEQPIVAYEHNQRSDGQTWQDVIKSNNSGRQLN